MNDDVESIAEQITWEKIREKLKIRIMDAFKNVSKIERVLPTEGEGAC